MSCDGRRTDRVDSRVLVESPDAEPA